MSLVNPANSKARCGRDHGTGAFSSTDQEAVSALAVALVYSGSRKCFLFLAGSEALGIQRAQHLSSGMLTSSSLTLPCPKPLCRNPPISWLHRLEIFALIQGKS